MAMAKINVIGWTGFLSTYEMGFCMVLLEALVDCVAGGVKKEDLRRGVFCDQGGLMMA